MNTLTKILKYYNRTGLRGSFRLTNFLSHRLKSLQDIAVETEDGIVHLDLRIYSATRILCYPKCLSGEKQAMKIFVKKGDIAFDVGAHFGFYTLVLANLVGKEGKVFSFEPNPQITPSLRKTISSLGNVELMEICLSDQNGKVKLFIPEDASMEAFGTGLLNLPVMSMKLPVNPLDLMI